MENETLRNLIEEQQHGYENEPLFTVGLQLLDIAEKEPQNAEILEKDLSTEGMKLSDAAKKLKEYADKNHSKANFFCITPKIAEKILREFYGISDSSEEVKTETESGGSEYIDLSSFL